MAHSGVVSISRYVAILRTRPVGYLFATSLLARLPHAMASVALALLVTAHGNYAQAGVVVGAYVLGGALSAPGTARLIDRFGSIRVLRPMALASAGVLIAVSQMSFSPPWLLVSGAFVAGAVSPPINAASRSLWPMVLDGGDRDATYAMDATFQERIYMAGPALVALAVDVGGAPLAVGLTGVVGAVGTLAFVAHPAAATRGKREGHVLITRHAPIAWALLVAGGLVGASFSTVELATISFARALSAPAAAGLLLALWSLGSLVAGLWWGGRVSRQPAQWLAPMVLLLAALTALLAVAGGLLQLAILLFTAGLAVAPAFGMFYRLVGEESPVTKRTEAFGWLSTAVLAGAALGASLGGALVQNGGPGVGFAAAGGIAALGVPGLLWHYRVHRPPPAAVNSSE